MLCNMQVLCNTLLCNTLLYNRMVIYNLPCMLYNILMVLYNMLYSMLHVITHNTCPLLISTVIIRRHRLLPAPLQRLSCPSSSILCSFLSPLLRFFHSDMAWLAPAIPPHPEVELVQPTSVASPRTGVGNSSLAVAKSMGQGGRAVSTHEARHQWHTTQHVLSPAQI